MGLRTPRFQRHSPLPVELGTPTFWCHPPVRAPAGAQHHLGRQSGTRSPPEPLPRTHRDTHGTAGQQDTGHGTAGCYPAVRARRAEEGPGRSGGSDTPCPPRGGGTCGQGGTPTPAGGPGQAPEPAGDPWNSNPPDSPRPTLSFPSERTEGRTRDLHAEYPHFRINTAFLGIGSAGRSIEGVSV